MRADFYLLSRDPVEAALPRIARSVKGAGERLLVVSDDAGQLAALDKALWEQFPEDFLAHGMAGEAHAARQPLLLGQAYTEENEARFVAFADGVWRDEGFGFERALLFFDEAGRTGARETWRLFDERDDVTREFHELDGGKWVQKA